LLSFFLFFFFCGTGFELRASSSCSTTWATPPVLSCFSQVFATAMEKVINTEQEAIMCGHTVWLI
jgi:hypothetical protein